MKRYAFDKRDSGLHDAALWAIHDALDIDGMAAALVKKLKPQVKLSDIPKDLSKWAKKLPPESWKARIAAIIAERIDGLRDQVAELAQEGIKDGKHRHHHTQTLDAPTTRRPCPACHRAGCLVSAATDPEARYCRHVASDRPVGTISQLHELRHGPTWTAVASAEP